MEPKAIEVHKALADDTRYRLYRSLRRTGRPVSVSELATRLSLHPNTLRPHLRRLEDAGLVIREASRADGVGRPQARYSAVETEERADEPYRLLTEILAGLVRGARSTERAQDTAAAWGAYLVAQDTPKPGAKQPERRNLAVLQEAMARAGFDPRFRKAGSKRIEISLRACPARDLRDEHPELICAVHRGLLAGMVGAIRPPLEVRSLEPLADKGTCRLVAGA